MRWRRSGVRDFFFTLKALPHHVRLLHPNTVYNLVIPPIVGIVIVLTLLIAPFTDVNWWISPFVFVLWEAAPTKKGFARTKANRDGGRPERRRCPCGEAHLGNTSCGERPTPRCLRGFLFSAK